MKTYTLLFVSITIVISSCERCYECTGDIPVFVNGVQAGSVENTAEFCESGLRAQAEAQAYEDEGYTCTEK